MNTETLSHRFNGVFSSTGSAVPATPIALTIAGSDPISGAGIQADLKTFSAHDVYGLSVITSITAQNTHGVQAVYPVSTDVVKKQCESIIADIPFKVLKTGMIYDAESINFVADFIVQNDLIAVIDTPFVSSSGTALMEKKAIDIFSETLLPAAAIVTPNISEAEILTSTKISSKDDMEICASLLLEKGAKAVLVKGGHSSGECSSDFLKTESGSLWLEEIRIDGENPHGTGCALSAAIAANLALGFSLVESVKISKTYVTDAIRNAITIGNGRKLLLHSLLIPQL